MVSPSTLRQGGYMLQHGSRWGSWFQQFYNGHIRGKHITPVYDHCQTVDQPNPHWSTTHVSNWIKKRIENVVETITDENLRLCPCLEYFNPSYDITTSIFPMFHPDFMGIAGISGMDQWIFDS